MPWPSGNGGTPEAASGFDGGRPVQRGGDDRPAIEGAPRLPAGSIPGVDLKNPPDLLVLMAAENPEPKTAPAAYRTFGNVGGDVIRHGEQRNALQTDPGGGRHQRVFKVVHRPHFPLGVLHGEPFDAQIDDDAERAVSFPKKRPPVDLSILEQDLARQGLHTLGSASLQLYHGSEPMGIWASAPGSGVRG